MDFYKIFSIALGLSQFIFGWLFWSLRREFVSQQTCNERKMCMQDEVGKLKTRTQVLEDRTEEIRRLTKSIEYLTKEMHELKTSIQLNTQNMAHFRELSNRK